MRYQFTPAAERAIAAAALWTTCDDPGELEPPELLLGLLAESECRAARMLAACGIDASQVLVRWPALHQQELDATARSRQWSHAVELSLAACANRLEDFTHPLVLATEHILLGLASADHEVAGWLADQGLRADALESEILRLVGYQSGPLPFDDGSAPTPQVGRAVSLPERTVEVGLVVSGWQETTGALRVLDAAANRGREGLRVVEDYVRFVLDDAHLTGQLKHLRHDLTAVLAEVPIADRLACRDTQADVGTQITTAGEQNRGDVGDVVAANFKRLQESLRSLEEYSKVVAPATAAQFERLRYQSYTLERAVATTAESLARLVNARLYVLIDGGKSVEAFCRHVESLVAAGVHVLQLRDKNLSDRDLVERARRLRQLTIGSDTLCIVNDRPDLAALSGADGVHMGQEELSVKDARCIVGPRALIGVSTHSLDQARQAVLDGANYIGVGPTFASGTKAFASTQLTGVELLAAVAREIRLPAFAIGGITSENLPQVLATGIPGVAVSGAIADSAHPAQTARSFLAALGTGS